MKIEYTKEDDSKSYFEYFYYATDFTDLETAENCYQIFYMLWLFDESDEVFYKSNKMTDEQKNDFVNGILFDEQNPNYFSMIDFQDIVLSQKKNNISFDENDYIELLSNRINEMTLSYNCFSDSYIKKKKIEIFKKVIEKRKNIVSTLTVKTYVKIESILDGYGKDYFFYSNEDKKRFIDILIEFFNNNQTSNTSNNITTKKNIKTNLLKALKEIYQYCSTNENLPKDDSFYNALNGITCFQNITYIDFNKKLRRS